MVALWCSKLLLLQSPGIRKKKKKKTNNRRKISTTTVAKPQHQIIPNALPKIVSRI
jgi:hypothetical protein